MRLLKADPSADRDDWTAGMASGRRQLTAIPNGQALLDGHVRRAYGCHLEGDGNGRIELSEGLRLGNH